MRVAGETLRLQDTHAIFRLLGCTSRIVQRVDPVRVLRCGCCFVSCTPTFAMRPFFMPSRPAQLQTASGVSKGASWRARQPQFGNIVNGPNAKDCVCEIARSIACACCKIDVRLACSAGNGLHSYRLAESIFLGAIPVIVDPKLILPFCQVLDWREFSVRVHPDRIRDLPQLLRAIPPQRIESMKRRLLEVKRKYFLYPFATALSLIEMRIRAGLAASSSK
eukprot:1549468-Pleurochrysis_carterae.AAC.4